MRLRAPALIGLFLVTLSTLLEELLLTRIFSVMLGYHFAFMAISIATFGLTVGGVLVYLSPDCFTPEQAPAHLARHALWFGVSIVVSLLICLNIPVVLSLSFVDPLCLVVTYVVITIPFIFSGICVCVALTQGAQQISALYAADLLGAAIGCLLFIPLMHVTDGPSAVLVAAALACFGAAAFAMENATRSLQRSAWLCGLLLAGFALFQATLFPRSADLLRLKWVRGHYEPPSLYERWSALSRVTVTGDPAISSAPFGWGLSSIYPSDRHARQLKIHIDAGSDTVVTAFHGAIEEIDHVRYDVTNLAHYLRPHAKVLVLGAGGGRGILSAIAFGQQSVTAVELDSNIVDVVNNRFGDFTGHLDRDPRVRFVADEARSYVARQQDRVDLIEVSFVASWLSGSAGAFVLTEHPLYTVEAWRSLLDHLTPGGILMMSRWYNPRLPAEFYRLTALASTSLLQRGIRDPRRHLIIVRPGPREGQYGDRAGVGTLLMSPQPFSNDDLDRVEALAKTLKFQIILSPRAAFSSDWTTLASAEGLPTFISRFPLDISVPTDDRPFFFHLSRLRDVFNRQRGRDLSYRYAETLLGVLLLIVIGLTGLCVVIPLLLRAAPLTVGKPWPFVFFFASIGLGFMFLEVSQLQRLIIVLGHPTYSLSVVLFTLLLSSGLGSAVTAGVADVNVRGALIVRLCVLLGLLSLFGLMTPRVLAACADSTTPIRILLAAGLLAPIGFLMGMAFPLGMRLASHQFASLTPWLWGINGATSVCASVFAVGVAMDAGISASFWTGVACYVVALLATVSIREPPTR